MTAEIAILNKLAVALATDSAVTITSGTSEEKTFDSADKLFELSYSNPIGIMINDNMQFMQAPLSVIIAEYRDQCKSFPSVKEVAYDFLKFLSSWGHDCPDIVLHAALYQILNPIFEELNKRLSRRIHEYIDSISPDEISAFHEKVKELKNSNADLFIRYYNELQNSDFIGGAFSLDAGQEDTLRMLVRSMPGYDEDLDDRLFELAKLILQKRGGIGQTGIIVAGFGSNEKFPSLVSFEIDGMIFDRLKYAEVNYVDIDRAGECARVIPFAQKEMVERFLYGLDSDIERKLTVFCQNNVTEIRTQILSLLDMGDAERERLAEIAAKAEQSFIDGLRDRQFEEIRTSSRAEIEGMVEFMPKPEMANMAEALVNLTSIKRRVSRGMETVGGPIDVAVISRTEGFVWVKRKHYFPRELNPRYGLRVAGKQIREDTNHEEGRRDREG